MSNQDLSLSSMESTKTVKLGYLTQKNETTVKPLTAETLENLMTSQHVSSIMQQIEATDDMEKKSELKDQLPLILFHCQMPEDGKRPKKKTAVASGFCIHDWDHMTVAPKTFYEQNIKGREEEYAIIMAHITPRGEGLRLVTIMENGEQIVQCQKRIGKLFGMQKFVDPKVKDISRGSFLPSKDYLLYINTTALFEHEVEEGGKEGQGGQGGQEVQEVQEVQGVQEVQEVQEDSIASSLCYDGVKYSSIIESLLKRIATHGQPCEGERNEDLFTLTREMRHICNYNFNSLYMLEAPYFSTLPDAEIRRTISNAIATNGRTITPVMRGVIDELKSLNVSATAIIEETKKAKLPKVSDVEEMILSKFPKHLRSQVYLAALPIWGTYATHVRFYFLDGRLNSPSFMTSVVGKSGSGKAFAAHLFDMMTPRFRNEDAQERQKADQYLAICNKTADSNEKPEDPRPKVRLYGDDITTCQLLDYLDNLKGEHGLQFTEEIARLQKSKRTVFGDNDDLYCKAFDNAIGGKESKSKQTRNIRIPIYLNTLFCGTPGAMHKFYNNPEGGLNNRVIFAFMPEYRMKGFPHYGRFTPEEQKIFDEATERLWEAGKDGGKLHLEWLDKAITRIKNQWDKEDDENPDEVWYDLGKRSLIMAYRAGVMQYLLRGCPEDDKSHREIIKLVKWMADTVRQNVYAFSGKDYEQIAETNNSLQKESQRRMTKNKKLFSLLPDDFTTQDVVKLRVQNGDSTDVRMVICRWTQDGMIVASGTGEYHKVEPLTA